MKISKALEYGIQCSELLDISILRAKRSSWLRDEIHRVLYGVGKRWLFTIKDLLHWKTQKWIQDTLKWEFKNEYKLFSSWLKYFFKINLLWDSRSAIQTTQHIWDARNLKLYFEY
jgi:hypothetical protein